METKRFVYNTIIVEIKRNMDSNISIINNNQGERLGIAGGNYRIIISGAQTNGNYAVIEMTVPSGGGPPPHSHPDTRACSVRLSRQDWKIYSGK